MNHLIFKQPWRSKAYRDMVRTLPSVISGMPADDPHHIKGNGFGGTSKCDDILCVPLTRMEHTAFHAGHLSFDQLSAALQTIALMARMGVLVVDRDAIRRFA